MEQETWVGTEMDSIMDDAFQQAMIALDVVAEAL